MMTEAALEAGAGEAWLLSWLGAVLGTALVGVSGLVPMLIIPLDAGPSLRSSAAIRSIGSTTGCTITEKAPTRAFSWLTVPTSAFKFKTLLRHYSKRALTPW